MRAQPPSQDGNRRRRAERPPVARQRCPYLEQILRQPVAFNLLTRYRADCHVDHATHTFTGRHPTPPCITDPPSCRLHQQEWAREQHLIDRYRD